jgi:AbrB family looped-hinge helix DNA binding protein
MSLVSVGQRFQIVIPKDVREQIGGLLPGEKIVVHAYTPTSFILSKTSASWIERTKGIAKEAWKKVDTTRFLEGIRDEWDVPKVRRKP